MAAAHETRPWLQLYLDEMVPDTVTVMNIHHHHHHQCYRKNGPLVDINHHHHSTPKNSQRCGHRTPCKRLLLEIKTDPRTGKTLSIRMADNEDDDDYHRHRNDIVVSLQMDDGGHGEQQTWPSDYGYGYGCGCCCCGSSHLSDDMTGQPPPSSSSSSSVPSQPPPLTPSATNGTSTTAISSNDSGVSSNMQSPSVTFNEKIEFLDPPESMEPTHRVLFKFCARHPDEVDLEIGDLVHVYQEFDDQWSSGLNIRTKCKGIFPSSIVVDVGCSEIWSVSEINSCTDKFPWNGFRVQRERYTLDFLGSIEVHKAKGEDILDDAIRRVTVGAEKPPPANSRLDIPFHCALDISDIGIRMYDRDPDCRRSVRGRHRHDYFFSLVQITYCGYQLQNERYYFAFITRHPAEQARFACHVFRGVNTGTREVAESVGRAFHRFYNRFVQG